MDACYYFESSGLNDTLTFATNSDGSKLVSMNIEVKDIKALANLERNPKKRRQLLERQFELFSGKVLLSKMQQGAPVEFQKELYNLQGEEMKVRKQGEVGEKKEEPEKSFIQKYWMQMLIGFLVIQAMSGSAEEPKRGAS